jgi:hypothetical protein
MREKAITIPEIIMIGGTRVALGIGVALLAADHLTKDQRKGAGWALLALGALTTIPLAIEVWGKKSFNDRPQLAA